MSATDFVSRVRLIAGKSPSVGVAPLTVRMAVVVLASYWPEAAWVALIEVVPTARMVAKFPTTFAILSSVTEKLHAPSEFEVGGVSSIAPTPQVVVTGGKTPKLGVTPCAAGVITPATSPKVMPLIAKILINLDFSLLCATLIRTRVTSDHINAGDILAVSREKLPVN